MKHAYIKFKLLRLYFIIYSNDIIDQFLLHWLLIIFSLENFNKYSFSFSFRMRGYGHNMQYKSYSNAVTSRPTQPSTSTSNSFTSKFDSYRPGGLTGSTLSSFDKLSSGKPKFLSDSITGIFIYGTFSSISKCLSLLFVITLNTLV